MHNKLLNIKKRGLPVRKQQILLVAFLLAMLSGCASMPGMPGYISEEKSSFDGSVQLSMEPAFVYRDNDGFSGSDLKLSLLWRSSMENDDIVLEAFVDDRQSRDSFRSLPLKPDRKSTRLNSSHVRISYAVFCLKKK